MSTNKKIENDNKRKGLQITILIAVIVIFIVIAVLAIKGNNKNELENENSEITENEVESYVQEIENGVKINTSSKLNEAKQVDGLTITNIQFTTKNGMSTLLADVINNNDTKSELKMVEITLLSQDGEELTTLTGIIDEISPNETTQLNIAMTSDFINAYDFKVSVK